MKKQLMTIITMVIILCVAFSNVVFATDSAFKFTLTPATSTVKPGDTVTLALNLSEVTGNTAVDMIAAKVVYDEDVFESVAYEETSGWNKLINSGVMLLQSESSEGNKNTGSIVNISLKVKSDAKEGDYTIKIEAVDDGVVGADQKEYDLGSLSAKVTVKNSTEASSGNLDDEGIEDGNDGDDQNNEGEDGNGENGKDENTKSEDNENTDEQKKSKSDDSSKSSSDTSKSTETTKATANTSTSKLPYTGVEAGLGIAVIGALVATVIAGIKYIKYKSVK